MADVELVFPYELGADRPWVLPPLGLGYLAAILKERNMSFGITDCTFTGLEDGIKRILARRPRIVGVYSMVTLGQNARRMARALKGKVDFLVAGGPLPTAYPGQFLGDFDFCVLGEAEYAFAELAGSLLEGREASGIAGVVPAGNEGRTAPLRVADLASVPHPERDGFPNERYREYWKENYGYSPASIIATRGCPYHCDFCSRPVSGSDFRKRAASDIVHEVRKINALGYDYLWFADDAFTYDTRLVVDVANGIRSLDPGIRWDCLSRTDGIDEDLVRTMREGGLERVYLGMESGSDETLRLMKKGARVADSENALGLFSASGVKVGGFFMVGYPGETAESIWSTLEFSARSELEYISYTVPYPLPGSPLYERMQGYVDPSAEWSRERENAVLYKSEMPEAALKEAIRLAYEAHAIARKDGRESALAFLGARRDELLARLKGNCGGG